MDFIKEQIVKGLFFLFSLCIHADETTYEGHAAERALDAAIQSFEKKMEGKFSLKCCKVGARMPYDIEEVIIGFSTEKTATIEDARKIGLYFMEQFLATVNEDENVRPYLREYPFTSKRVFLTFSFRLEGSPHKELYVSLVKNQIVYKTCSGTLNPYEEILREPYEDAVKLVRKI